jgi:hypothetical protein
MKEQPRFGRGGAVTSGIKSAGVMTVGLQAGRLCRIFNPSLTEMQAFGTG